MQRSWLGCIIALVVLVGISFGDDAIYGYIHYNGQPESLATVYARCAEDDPPCQVYGVEEDYAYRVAESGSWPVIVVDHVGDWKVKAYKWDVGESGWTNYHTLDREYHNHYYEVLNMIPLPKK